MAAYAIVIEQRGSCFRAYVPDVPGCTATFLSSDSSLAMNSQEAPMPMRPATTSSQA